MTPIRPTALPPTPPAAPSQEAARLAAQKAFFAMAFGQTRPAAVSTPPAATAAATIVAAPVVRIPAPQTDGAQKLPRPGSILDIRV